MSRSSKLETWEKVKTLDPVNYLGLKVTGMTDESIYKTNSENDMMVCINRFNDATFGQAQEEKDENEEGDSEPTSEPVEVEDEPTEDLEPESKPKNEDVKEGQTEPLKDFFPDESLDDEPVEVEFIEDDDEDEDEKVTPTEDDYEYPCDHCDEKFLTAIIRQVHIDEVHTPQPPEPSFECEECGNIVLESGRQDHIDEEHPPKLPGFPCYEEDCDEVFHTEEERDSHMVEEHPPEEDPEITRLKEKMNNLPIHHPMRKRLHKHLTKMGVLE